MCIAMPRRVLSVSGALAVVDVDGERREVRLDAVEEAVAVGDYVVEQSGYVLHRVPEEEVAETLALFERLMEHLER